MERRLGKTKTNPGIYAGFAPVFYTGFTGSGAYSPARRYYGVHTLVITAGMNYDFFVFDKIHLFTDINYTAGAISLSLGYGF
jgi:hypothetical protein